MKGRYREGECGGRIRRRAIDTRESPRVEWIAAALDFPSLRFSRFFRSSRRDATAPFTLLTHTHATHPLSLVRVCALALIAIGIDNHAARRNAGGSSFFFLFFLTSERACGFNEYGGIRGKIACAATVWANCAEEAARVSSMLPVSGAGYVCRGCA